MGSENLMVDSRSCSERVYLWKYCLECPVCGLVSLDILVALTGRQTLSLLMEGRLEWGQWQKSIFRVYLFSFVYPQCE